MNERDIEFEYDGDDETHIQPNLKNVKKCIKELVDKYEKLKKENEELKLTAFKTLEFTKMVSVSIAKIKIYIDTLERENKKLKKEIKDKSESEGTT